MINSIPCLRQKSRKTYPGWPHVTIKPLQGSTPPPRAKYGDRFAFGGCYFVNKESKGREYGKKIYDAAMASAKHFPTIGAVSDLPQEEMHKRNGFRSQFYGAFFVFNIPATMACFSETSKRSPVKIRSIEEVSLIHV